MLVRALGCVFSLWVGIYCGMGIVVILGLDIELLHPLVDGNIALVFSYFNRMLLMSITMMVIFFGCYFISVLTSSITKLSKGWFGKILNNFECFILLPSIVSTCYYILIPSYFCRGNSLVSSFGYYFTVPASLLVTCGYLLTLVSIVFDLMRKAELRTEIIK